MYIYIYIYIYIFIYIYIYSYSNSICFITKMLNNISSEAIYAGDH